jgi:hypothetical protein
LDDTLATLLMAYERMDALAVSDRVSAIDALAAELPRLSKLSAQEWDEKLADIEEDIARLAESAAQAKARYEQGRRVFETLRRLAARAGADDTHADEHEALSGNGVRRFQERDDANGRRETAVAQAGSTRDAILQVMARRPHHRWTVVGVTDDLLRYGRPVERSNVQVTLRRLAGDGKVVKDGRGTYIIAPEAIPPSNGSVAERWLPVAEQAADAFENAHPGEVERAELIERALRSVETYKGNHDGREPPDGEPGVRRLMKTRLYELHRRIQQGGDD